MGHITVAESFKNLAFVLSYPVALEVLNCFNWVSQELR